MNRSEINDRLEVYTENDFNHIHVRINDLDEVEMDGYFTLRNLDEVMAILSDWDFRSKWMDQWPETRKELSRPDGDVEINDKPVISLIDFLNSTDDYDVAYRHAVGVATSLWEEYFKEVSPNWKPVNTLSGVISQIDDMAHLRR